MLELMVRNGYDGSFPANRSDQLRTCRLEERSGVNNEGTPQFRGWDGVSGKTDPMEEQAMRLQMTLGLGSGIAWLFLSPFLSVRLGALVGPNALPLVSAAAGITGAVKTMVDVVEAPSSGRQNRDELGLREARGANREHFERLETHIERQEAKDRRIGRPSMEA
jgi:hypothetical protein